MKNCWEGQKSQTNKHTNTAANSSPSEIFLHICIIWRLFYKWWSEHFAQMSIAFVLHNWGFGGEMYHLSFIRVCQYLHRLLYLVTKTRGCFVVFQSQSPASILTNEDVLWNFTHFKIIEASVNEVDFKFTWISFPSSRESFVPLKWRVVSPVMNPLTTAGLFEHKWGPNFENVLLF